MIQRFRVFFYIDRELGEAGTAPDLPVPIEEEKAFIRNLILNHKALPGPIVTELGVDVKEV